MLEDSAIAELLDISDDSGTDEEAGVNELDTGAALEEELSGACTELEDGSSAELFPSAELGKLTPDELSGVGTSAPELVSSPHATKPAAATAHKKTRA